jgi:hypothetical protein
MSTFLKLIIPVVIVMVGVFYFFAFTGVVWISPTIPHGATVQIDGIVVGTAPLKRRVRAGVHQITVYKEGFETWRGEEKVSGILSGIPGVRVSVKLPFLLRSDPTGADVIMDGDHIGKTELAIHLRPGVPHTFEFKKDGYQTEKFSANIPLDVGEPIPIVTLTPAGAPPPEERWPAKEPPPPEYGVIQVTSTPDAQVYLDGEWQGETPLTIKKVLVGSYVITLSREGYRDMRRTVYVEKDKTARIAGELKPKSVEQ